MKIWCELCKGKGGGTQKGETMNYVCNFCAGEGYLEVDDQPTLRDQFAMAALTGLQAHPGCGINDEKELARFSYIQADAMIAEREQ